MVKNPCDNAGDAGGMDLILGSGRFPGGGNGNTLQYSCLENSFEPGGLQSIGSHRFGETQAVSTAQWLTVMK